MAETQAKYHHLIPQTYMSAWANGSGTLKVKFINNPDEIVERNKENIAGVNDFHSIKAGMPLCTQADTDAIFSSIFPYTVELDGIVLSDSLALNSKYYDFDRWCITRSDGTAVSKKKVKHEIEQIKIKDIEENWSTKYENGWSEEVKRITQAVCTARGSEIPEFDKEYLIKFFTALDWRGFNSNQQFEETLHTLTKEIFVGLDIPEEKRILPCLKTVFDEMRHYLLLKYYRNFLHETGVIYADAMANLQHTSFHFLIADGPTQFLTSDTPAFVHKREDGKLVGLLPITPNILMAKGRYSDKDDKYCISHITDAAVQKYNDAIYANAVEFVILPNIP